MHWFFTQKNKQRKFFDLKWEIANKNSITPTESFIFLSHRNWTTHNWPETRDCIWWLCWTVDSSRVQFPKLIKSKCTKKWSTWSDAVTQWAIESQTAVQKLKWKSTEKIKKKSSTAFISCASIENRTFFSHKVWINTEEDVCAFDEVCYSQMVFIKRQEQLKHFLKRCLPADRVCLHFIVDFIQIWRSCWWQFFHFYFNFVPTKTFHVFLWRCTLVSQLFFVRSTMKYREVNSIGWTRIKKIVTLRH